MSNEDYEDWFDLFAAKQSQQFGSAHPLGDPSLARQFLDQGDAWCDRFKAYLKIEDMDPGYAVAAANFIMARAQSVALVVYAGGGDGDAENAIVSDYWARRWLLETPLVKALVARGRSGVPTPFPWVAALRKARRRIR